MSLARVQNRSSGHGELCLRQVPDSFPRNRLTVSTSVTRERGGNQKVPLSGVPVQTGRCQRRGPRPTSKPLPGHPVKDVRSNFLACTADCKRIFETRLSCRPVKVAKNVSQELVEELAHGHSVATTVGHTAGTWEAVKYAVVPRRARSQGS